MNITKHRYISRPWGPYCWGCNSTEHLIKGRTCQNCAGSTRETIPWAELFTHGGKVPFYPNQAKPPTYEGGV